MQTQTHILALIPHYGVGPVKLGSARSEARAVLSAVGFPLEDTHGSIDYFCDASIQTECDSSDQIQFIGISYSDRFIALFQGKDIFSLEARGLFSLIANADQSGAHRFTSSEYYFPNQIVTLWDADEQYDHKGGWTRPVWAQMGLGNATYASAVAVISSKV